jgi:hypothetical protein
MSLLLSLLLFFLIAIYVNSFNYELLCRNNNNIRFTKNRLLEMKGKGNRVPIDQRGEFLKRQRMMEVQKEMYKTKADSSVPIFKVFVRPKAGGLWIPCGDLAGDQRSAALVTAWMSGFMTDMYKGQLDNGIARSLFTQEDAFVKNIVENFKPFKKFTKDDLEFGYKIEFAGLEEKMGEQKIMKIEKGMEKTWVDKAKENFGNLFWKEDQ